MAIMKFANPTTAHVDSKRRGRFEPGDLIVSHTRSPKGAANRRIRIQNDGLRIARAAKFWKDRAESH
ncbi:MAG: hypothetical protein E6K17_04195 [Methanobacteriota archaeon]|nr:MAG: hypothetical protein E6K17_04195 [Euryarchaeota archaeon]